MNTKTNNKNILGIDLGTTNSVMAILQEEVPKIIPNDLGEHTTPSVIAYLKSGDLLVGTPAKRQGISNPENTFYSFKQFIGRKYNEISNHLNQISYLIKNDTLNNLKIYAPIIKQEFTPQELSATLLKKLHLDATKFLNQTIKHAVITVPAYFNNSQRFATKEAALLAGFDQINLLNEPTAAALAYAFRAKKNETILIFDLGGGTFDVSILEIEGEIFEVLATAGDTSFGGDKFDQVIVQLIINEFYKTEQIDLYQNKVAFQRILAAAEQAKIKLSTLMSTKIDLPFICMIEMEPKHISFELTRSKFEELSKYLISQCKAPIIKALEDAKLTTKQLDQVILVGGSTRIPAIKTFIKHTLNKPLTEIIYPDEAVALGAAIQGGILGGAITDVVLLDVTPLTLGIEISNGLMEPIIKRNSPLPIKKIKTFTTSNDYQTAVEVNILQGERFFAKDNMSLGLFKLFGLPALIKGVLNIFVSFQLDSNGILSVSAKEKVTKISHGITINNSIKLSSKTINHFIANASFYEVRDWTRTVFTLYLHFSALVFKIENEMANFFIFNKNSLPADLLLHLFTPKVIRNTLYKLALRKDIYSRSDAIFILLLERYTLKLLGLYRRRT